jgi:hypothetical protein
VEEIESLGRSERYAIESHLQNLLTHLLKWRCDPATAPRRGWRIAIRNARLDIAKRARGRLQDYPAQYLAMAYLHAREDAADETDLPLTTFPEACPWPVEQVLAPDFWPDTPFRAGCHSSGGLLGAMVKSSVRKERGYGNNEHTIRN